MGTFTTPLKRALTFVYDEDIERETVTFKSESYDELPILPDNGKAIGLSQYPIFDEDYRSILNGKILDEYWNREIGAETIDDFRLMLRRKMQQIMPYYNKLYESEQLDYSALDTMNINSVSNGTVTGQENSTATSETNSDNKSKSRVVNSETPQTQLSGNEDYASGATDTTSESDIAGSGSQDSESSSQSETANNNVVKGYQGVASELVARWRNAQINIDTMIITEIQDCFMLLLNNGDSYTPNWSY